MWDKLDLKKMETLNPKPSAHKFSVFVFLVSIFLVWLWPSIWSAVFALSLALIALRFSKWLNPFNTFWHRTGLVISYALSPIILSVFYVVIFCPFAIVLKSLGHKAFPNSGWVQTDKHIDFSKTF